MSGNYHTGLKIHSYEVTISPRLGLGVEKIRTFDNLPHSSHEEFQQELNTVLLNAGITLTQYIVTYKLKQK